MDQYSRGYNPNWYSHKYNQDNKSGNNSKLNKNSYDLKQKSDYNYYNRPLNSKSGYNERSYDYNNNGNIGISRDSKERVKYYEPESTSNQWSTSSNSSSTSNRNSYYRPNQRLSNNISMKKMESIISDQSLPRSNSVPKLNSSTLGYFKTPSRIDINPHSRTYTSEKYYDDKSKENFLPNNNNSKNSIDSSNKFDQEFPALGTSKKPEPKYSRPYSYSSVSSSVSNNSNNNSSVSTSNTWSNTSSASQSNNTGYKSYNSIVNNRMSTGNNNLSNGNSSRPWGDKKSNSVSYDSQQPQRIDSSASSPYENSSSTLSSIVSQSIKNNNLSNSNNYSNGNLYSNDNSSNNIINSSSSNHSNSLSSTPTPVSNVSVNGGFAAAAAVSSTTNTNVESSNSELMKLRQLVPKISSQSRSKANYSRVKVNPPRPLSNPIRRSATPVGLKVSLSSDVINGITSTKLHTSAPSSPKSSSNSSATPILSAKHKNKSSSRFFKELRKLGLSNNSKVNQDDKNDNNSSEVSEKSTTIRENDTDKNDNSEISEKNLNTATIDNTDTSSEENVLEEEEKLRSSNEDIIISDTKENEDQSENEKNNDNNNNKGNECDQSNVLNIPIQESHNKIKSSREKYFAVPYSASLEKEEQFMTSLGWNKQQYGYEDSDVEDGEWEITDEEKIKFYNIFNNDCKNIFKTLEPKTNKNNITRKCLECSTCFACPFPCTICGSILLESGGLNNRMIHLHKHSKNNPSLLSQISTIDDSFTDSEECNSEVSPSDKNTTNLSDNNSIKENDIKQHHHVCQIHNENHYKNEQNQMNSNDDEEIFELK